MASEREGCGPSLPGKGWGPHALPIEEALAATFPIRGPLEWLCLPPRSVNGLGLAAALPLEACPRALGRGRLVARDGEGRIYLVDCLSSLPPCPREALARPPALSGAKRSSLARRETGLLAAYQESGARPPRPSLQAGSGLEILASLYYLVVLCGCDAYSLILDDCPARLWRGTRAGLAGQAKAGPSGTGDSFLSSRCRIFRPCPRPGASS